MSEGFVEHDFLAQLRKLPADPRLLIPIGDDAALLADGGQGILLAADTVVEGVHCESGPSAPEILARKAVRSNLSDLAAMGGYGESLLLNMVIPHVDARSVAERILKVVSQECTRFAVAFAGGDTVCAGDRIVLAVSVSGRTYAEPIRRSGAQVGDLVVVTGELGGSILGHHAEFEPRCPEAEQLVALGPPSAMADISDGFLRDLSNILVASGVGAVIGAERVPIAQSAMDLAAKYGESTPLDHALNDGEDFELVFTISPERFQLLADKWNMATKLSVTGEVVRTGLWLKQGTTTREVVPGGFDHGKKQ